MTAAEVIEELKSLGSESYRKVLFNHQVNEPVLGVKISELKRLQKKIKRDYELSKQLFNSGIYDAQYLAGLIADDEKMTQKDLKHWLATSNSPAISSYTVAWVAADGRFGRELGLEWIKSKKEQTATAGWCTLGSWVSVTDDLELDFDELIELIEHIVETIHQQPNSVRYAMNGFLITCGTYVVTLHEPAMRAAKAVGVVSVDMGNTACEVPSAAAALAKAKAKGVVGKKRKSAKC